MATYLHQILHDLIPEVCRYLRHNEVLLLESLGIVIEYEKLIMRIYPVYYQMLKQIHVYYPKRYRYDSDQYILINKADLLNRYNSKDDTNYGLRITDSITFMKNVGKNEELSNILSLSRLCASVDKNIYDKYYFSLPSIKHVKDNYLLACYLYKQHVFDTKSVSIQDLYTMCESYVYFYNKKDGGFMLYRLDTLIVLIILLFLLHNEYNDIYNKDIISSYIKYIISDIINSNTKNIGDIQLLIYYLESSLNN